MNCEELQCDLPDILDGKRSPDQDSHLRSCRMCSGLLADLELISQEARQLRAADEPSPRVWNSIEMALRQEGLIHAPRRGAAAMFPHWAPAGWLVPIAATFLVALTVARYELRPYGPTPVAERVGTVVTASLDSGTAAPIDDQQMLEVMSSRSPAMRASYAADLERVNAYIRDAEESAHSNPNDEEAQRYLMDAHEEKAMMYEMALDRSLQ